MLLLGAAAGVLAVFLGVLLVLSAGGGGARPPAVLINLATPARTPTAARGVVSSSPASTVFTSPAPAPRTPTAAAAAVTPTTALSPTRTPSPSPSPAPTSSPVPSPAPARSPSSSPSPAPTSPPVRGLPDLALQDFDLVPSGPAAGTLRITVSNPGQADLVQQGIEIVGFDQTDTEVVHFTSAPITILAGGSVSIASSYKPSKRTTLTVVINPNHRIAEADAPPGFDDPNNARTKTVTPP
ncbi:MAG: hypothetical protein ACYDCQ_06785 [Dehalococcoidia bacterium]